MPEITNKPSAKVLAAAGCITALVGVLFWQVLHLSSNLKSSTRITQSLRDEIETLRRESASYRSHAETGDTQIQTLNQELSQVKVDKEEAARKQTELQQRVETADKSLEGQNAKIQELERKLKDSEAKIRRQERASATLEQRTRDARTSPGMSADYVKIVENEWLAATAKTEELKKDLDKTLGELSGQNSERSKLRAETATMHYNLAVILTEQQNYPAAIREYEKVLETRPNDADAHYNLAIIYDDYLKNNDQAIKHYREYIRIAPDSPEAQRVRQWMKDKEFDNALKFKL